MHKYSKTALAVFGVFLLATSSCGSKNETMEEASTQQLLIDSVSGSVEETESIAGLPQQKDTLASGKKEYTNLKFATADDAVAYMQKSQDWPKYQEGIFPQIASEELSYTTKLLNSPYKRFIVVDKDKMKVILFDRYGRVEKQYPMAGPRNYGTKHAKGDSRTPEGFFSAEGIYDSSDWEFTDDNGVRHPGKCFGPRFVRVKNPVTTQVGIHGTSAPGSIGRRTSHGCIRLHNASILDLVKYVEIGMPIIILPGPTDREVNAREGSPTGYFNTGVERATGSQTAPGKSSAKPQSAKPQNNSENKTEPEVQPTPEEPSGTPTEPEKEETPKQEEPVVPVEG